MSISLWHRKKGKRDLNGEQLCTVVVVVFYTNPKLKRCAAHVNGSSARRESYACPRNIQPKMELSDLPSCRTFLSYCAVDQESHTWDTEDDSCSHVWNSPLLSRKSIWLKRALILFSCPVTCSLILFSFPATCSLFLCFKEEEYFSEQICPNKNNTGGGNLKNYSARTT